jgi:hypothetical protein
LKIGNFGKEPVMADGDDFNGKVISEFRANGGKVGGFFEGAPSCCFTMPEPRRVPNG